LPPSTTTISPTPGSRAERRAATIPSASFNAGTTTEIVGDRSPGRLPDCAVSRCGLSGRMTQLHRSRHPRRPGAYVLGALLVAALTLTPAPGVAGLDVVRFDGIVGETGVARSVGDLTLAIGAKSISYSVLGARKVTGAPATAPEIFSALGP